MKIFIKIILIIQYILLVPNIWFCQCQVSEEWRAHYIGPDNNDFILAMAVDVYGNVYVTGSSNRTATIIDYATVKYNTSGTQQWAARYNWPNFNTNGGAVAWAIALDNYGNVYVTGTAPISINSGPTKTTTIKYNSSGVQQWVAIFFSDSYEACDGNPSIALYDSDVYVATSSYWSEYGYCYIIIKYNSSGTQQWFALYKGPGNGTNQPCRIAVDNSGNVYVTGYSMGDTTGNDIATVKYNSLGRQQWVARYNGPGNGGDSATDMKVDNLGNVYVCGRSWGGDSTRYEYITIKYNSSGIQQWASLYNGNAYFNQYAKSIAVDNYGNVYITGSSHDLYSTTIKYNSSGVQQWVKNYDYDGYGSWGVSIAVDKYGYVYVLAASNEGIRLHFATIKYSPDSTQIWVIRTYSQTGEYPIGLTLDSSLNVFAAGSDANFLTIKYDQLLGINPVSNSIPNEFKLYQNYPNPFNPSTKISYAIPPAPSGKPAKVIIKVYDLLGRFIKELVNENKDAGFYYVNFDGTNLASGIYFYKIEVNELKGKNYVQSGRMLLLK